MSQIPALEVTSAIEYMQANRFDLVLYQCAMHMSCELNFDTTVCLMKSSSSFVFAEILFLLQNRTSKPEDLLYFHNKPMEVVSDKRNLKIRQTDQ